MNRRAYRRLHARLRAEGRLRIVKPRAGAGLRADGASLRRACGPRRPRAARLDLPLGAPAEDPGSHPQADQRRSRSTIWRLGARFLPTGHERLTEQDVLLAEPDRQAFGFEHVVQLRSNTAPVVPGMAEEEVAKFRLLTSRLDRAAIGSQRPDLVGGVGHRRAARRPPRPRSAADGPAPAAGAATAAPRLIGR